MAWWIPQWLWTLRSFCLWNGPKVPGAATPRLQPPFLLWAGPCRSSRISIAGFPQWIPQTTNARPATPTHSIRANLTIWTHFRLQAIQVCGSSGRSRNCTELCEGRKRTTQAMLADVVLRKQDRCFLRGHRTGMLRWNSDILCRAVWHAFRVPKQHGFPN